MASISDTSLALQITEIPEATTLVPFINIDDIQELLQLLGINGTSAIMIIILIALILMSVVLGSGGYVARTRCLLKQAKKNTMNTLSKRAKDLSAVV